MDIQSKAEKTSKWNHYTASLIVTNANQWKTLDVLCFRKNMTANIFFNLKHNGYKHA